ncbi:MAG: aminoglycoside phosphotransferase family protein [Oscillospiraceae bacterium]|nr:aminoglycoside phosphotransferase family protein [Oscillospiraceae bacterium]
MERKIQLLMNLYGINGKVKEYRKITNGHINETYYVLVENNNGLSETANPYIFQKVNTYVFKNPAAVMNNIMMLDNFIKNNNKKSACRIINFLVNGDYKNYTVTDDGEFWRICIFEENTITFEIVENPAVLRSSGYAFGDFLNVISDFPADKLNITIPDFHNTKKRLDNFFRIVEADENDRVKNVKDEIKIFEKYYDFCCKLTDMTDRGELPLRPVHNDTKYNNILLNKDTFEPVCVLDLDTIMPGLVAHDFGDAIRFAANRASEDETDLSKVFLDFDYFKEFTRGFISAVGKSMTELETETLALGAPTITLELASRFLADYIDGDKYFAVHREGHNLDRARCQMKLAEDMIEKLDVMREFVRKCAETI